MIPNSHLWDGYHIVDGIFRVLFHPKSHNTAHSQQWKSSCGSQGMAQWQHHAGPGTHRPQATLLGRELTLHLPLQFSSFVIHSLHTAAKDISGRDPDEELCFVFVTLEFPVKFI